jgi:DNA-binding NarL/FixJ family response regulator
VLIEGEAGIGKSRLLDEALVEAHDLALQVFHTRAEELDRHRPFGAIADCMGITRSSPEPRRADMARLLFGDHAPSAGSASVAPIGRSGPVVPPVGRSEGLGGLGGLPGATGLAGVRPEGQFWLVEALVTLVEDFCQRGPVVIAVDDLQWADTATLVVMHRLSRLVTRFPLVMLGACRPSPRPAPLARWLQGLAERGSVTIVLGPLGADAVTALVTEMLGRPPGSRLSRQATGAGGNPFLVTELVAALQASGVIGIEDDRAEIDVVALPPALKLTVAHRMSLLPADTVDVLRMASILGTSFSIRELTVVLGRSAVSLFRNLREAIEAGVLCDEGCRIAFRHHLLRDALYEDIPLALRVTLHHDVGQALATAGAPAVQVAEHFVRGTTPGDAAALSWMHRAADEVTVEAPGVAADLLRRIIDLFESGPDRDLVMANWVVSLETSGRMREAETACLDVLSRPQEPQTEVRLRLALSRLLAHRGRIDEALEQSGLALQIEGLSAAPRARALANASAIQLWTGDGFRAEELAQQALRAGAAAGDEIACAVSAYTLSVTALRSGRFQEAHHWAAKAKVSGDEQPSDGMAQGRRHLRQVGELALGSALLWLDRLDEAEVILARARTATEELGFKRLLGAAYRALMIRHYLAGDWDEALAQFGGVVEVCQGSDDPAMLVDASSLRRLIAVHRGRPSGEASLLPIVVSRETDGACWPVLAESLRAQASGRPGVALDLLARAWDRGVDNGSHGSFPMLGPDLVRLALSEGNLDRAHDVTGAVVTLAELNRNVASLTAAALLCRGLVQDDASVLLEAQAAYRNGQRPFEGARAGEDAAEALGRAGRTDEARRLFEEAIALYERLEAVWDAGRAASRMRSLGMRRGSRGSRRRPTNGWDSLTRSELAVVELVAQGLSNPEVAERLFLSRTTVKAHVSKALTKLAMSSRVELAREAVRRQMGADGFDDVSQPATELPARSRHQGPGGPTGSAGAATTP